MLSHNCGPLASITIWTEKPSSLPTVFLWPKPSLSSQDFYLLDISCRPHSRHIRLQAKLGFRIPVFRLLTREQHVNVCTSHVFCTDWDLRETWFASSKNMASSGFFNLWSVSFLFLEHEPGQKIIYSLTEN